MAKLDPVSDPWPRRGDRAAAADLRASGRAARDGRGGRRGRSRRRGHLMVEAGTGVGKSFAYLVPAIQAAVADEEKGRRLDPHDRLQEQLLQQGHTVPAFGDAARNSRRFWSRGGRTTSACGGSMWRSSARAESSSEPDEFDQLAGSGCGRARTGDGSRSDLDFKPLPSVWDAVRQRERQLPGQECPRHKECFFYQARRRVWSANILVVNHALFVSDLALRTSGFAAPAQVRRRHLRRGAHARGRCRRASGLKLSSRRSNSC